VTPCQLLFRHHRFEEVPRNIEVTWIRRCTLVKHWCLCTHALIGIRRRWRQHALFKCWYKYTNLSSYCHNSICICSAVTTLNLAHLHSSYTGRNFLGGPMPPHVHVDFVDLSPGHGRSVTDFWGWDAHEAQLRCPDDVSGDRGRCSARRALKPKFY